MFLVIDGWAALRQEFDALETRITAIAAQGLSSGVHVVVTASRWADIRPALKDQIGERGPQAAHVVPLGPGAGLPAGAGGADGADGTVSWYDEDKGFGFIAPDSSTGTCSSTLGLWSRASPG